MKFDVTVFAEDLNNASTLAKTVEDYGYDGLWVAEAAHNPFLPLAHAALATDRISLGTAIAVAFPRSPLLMAQTAWDLADNNRRADSPWAWAHRSSRILPSDSAPHGASRFNSCASTYWRCAPFGRHFNPAPNSTTVVNTTASRCRRRRSDRSRCSTVAFLFTSLA